MAEETPGVRMGNRLRALREARMLSQRELAAKAGVSEPTIAYIESGRTAHPRRVTAEKIAAGLGVSFEELAGMPTRPVPLKLEHMWRATPEERRRALGAASDAEVSRYVRSIDRAIDRAEGWQEQDREAWAAYTATLHSLRAETDPFDLQPPTPDQRAALVGAR